MRESKTKDKSQLGIALLATEKLEKFCPGIGETASWSSETTKMASYGFDPKELSSLWKP